MWTNEKASLTNEITKSVQNLFILSIILEYTLFPIRYESICLDGAVVVTI